jgi:hypothetical protein
MAAPIVIPAKTNPINDAIQYAGNSIKQAISLMQATKQLQVMEDANRLDAGKKLIDTAWNMFNSLANGSGDTPGVGPLEAFKQTKDIFANGMKALGMDDTSIANFAFNMSTGAASYADLRQRSLQYLIDGGGSYRNLPADPFNGTQQASDTTAKPAEGTPAPAATAPTVTAGTKTVTVDVPAPAIANPDYSQAKASEILDIALNEFSKGYKTASSTKDVQQLKLNTLDTYGKELQAEHDAGRMTQADYDKAHKALEQGTIGSMWATANPVRTWSTPSNNAVSSPSITTGETIKKNFTITGPMPNEIDTVDKKEKWFQNQKAAYEDMGAPHETASFLASSAIMLAPVVTPGKAAPAPAKGTSSTNASAGTQPAIVATLQSGRPLTPQFPTKPPATFAEVKPYVADASVPDDKAYPAFKNYYEWWAKTVAGVEFKGSDIRLSKGISDYLRSLPSLAERVTPDMANQFIAAQGGPDKFMASLNTAATNAEANLINAKANAADVAGKNAPFFVWNFKDSNGKPIKGFESITGKALNPTQLGVALTALGQLIEVQKNSDTAFKATYETAQKMAQTAADFEKEILTASLKNDPDGSKGLFLKAQKALYNSNTTYRSAYDGASAFLTNYMGWDPKQGEVIDVMRRRGGSSIFGKVWGVLGTFLLGPTTEEITTVPSATPPGGNGGATQGQAAQVDQSKSSSYSATFKTNNPVEPTNP